MRIDLDDIERKALAATPQGIDAAEIIEGDEGKTIECPACSGEGYVSLEGDYCNFDGCAIGVQFYGIGNEHGAAERFYRAANPAVVIELVRRLREAEKIEGVLIDALEQCRGRFAYYVQHHLDKGDLDKAAGNEFWVKVADDAIAKAQGLQPCQGRARQSVSILTEDEIKQATKTTETNSLLLFIARQVEEAFMKKNGLTQDAKSGD